MRNSVPDLNFHLEKGVMLDAQPGFADCFNRLVFMVQNMGGDDLTVQSSCSPDGRITFSAVRIRTTPQPFDIDMSDPQKIAVRNAIVTTGFMISGDTFPVMRVSQFTAPAPIACADVPTGAGNFVLWYLVTQVESELIAQTATNCKLSIDPDTDDPDHLLFRKPLYMLSITARPNGEGEGEYRYAIVADLRNSTLVRLS